MKYKHIKILPECATVHLCVTLTGEHEYHASMNQPLKKSLRATSSHSHERLCRSINMAEEWDKDPFPINMQSLFNVDKYLL